MIERFRNWLQHLRDMRCMRGEHVFRLRRSTFGEFLYQPLYDHGTCANCGVQLVRSRVGY